MTQIPAPGFPSNSANTVLTMMGWTENVDSVLREVVGGGAETTITLSSHSFNPGNNVYAFSMLPQSGLTDQLNSVAASTMRDSQILLVRLGTLLSGTEYIGTGGN